MELLKYLNSGSSLAQWLRLTRYPYAEMQQSFAVCLPLHSLPCFLSTLHCCQKRQKKSVLKKCLAIHKNNPLEDNKKHDFKTEQTCSQE